MRRPIQASASLGALLMLASGCGQQEGQPQPTQPPAAAVAADAPQAYRQYCTGCHAPPNPAAHHAAEWPPVVSRMQQRRISKGQGAIPAAVLGEILDYLQQHAADS